MFERREKSGDRTRGRTLLLLVMRGALVVGACKESDPSNGAEKCKEQTDCADGFLCDDGVCVEEKKDPPKPPKEDPKTPPKDDGAKYTEPCQKDEDCQKDLSCINTAEGSICTRICPPND